MNYVGTSSTNIAVAQGGAADLMWAVKSALLEAGWRLMSFGGGASSGVYQAPNGNGSTAVADGLTTAASLNVNGAWFRIKEPGVTSAGREYVFQRGDAATELNIKYSRASGFTGSNETYPVGEQNAPTTAGGDGVSLFSELTDESVRAEDGVATTLFTGRVHCIASSTASANGVWEFYALSTSGNSVPVIIYQAALVVGSHPAEDADPSFRGVGPVSQLVAKNASNANQNVASFWHAYDMGGSQAYVRYARMGQYWNYTGAITADTGTSNRATGRHAYGHINTEELSIYDGKVALYPGGTINGTDESSGKVRVTKGLVGGFKIFTAQRVIGDTFNLASADPHVAINSTTLGIAMPWVANNTPVF
jgi:hypothetical protein